MSFFSRLANVWRSEHLDRDLQDELQFHLEERTRELIEAGLAPDEAARQARRRFGSAVRVREEMRDIKLLPRLESIVRDVRLGARMMRKFPLVTGAAVLSLGLALGGCLAAFALVDALMLRPLPVHQPERLVYLTFPSGASDEPERETFNDPAFVRLRDAGRRSIDLFAMSTQVMRPVIFDAAAGKEAVRTQYLSGDAFDHLGVGPALGRVLTARDDESPGAHPVAVVSHAYWVRRFGADPAAIGQWFTLEGRPFQIVGVTASGFSGIEPGRPTDLWLPYAMYNQRAFGNPDFNWFRIVGRVNQGIGFEQAQSVLQAAFTGFRRDRLKTFGPERPDDSVARFISTPLYLRPASNGPSPLRAQFGRALWILATIASLVLLVAGSNVANLALARAAAREREMALRLSIGAGRGRLIQQVLIESALVAGLSCLLGLLFASISAPAVVAMLTSTDDPVHLDLRFDGRLALIGAAMAVITMALFALAPARRASSITLVSALKASGRTTTRAGVMRVLVAGQIAFGLVVLFVGSLLVLSFARLSNVDPGFSADGVLLVALEPANPLEPRAQRAALFELLDRLRQMPGIEQASSAESSVLGRPWTHYVRLPGSRQPIEATMAPITDGYFETMNIPLVAGRGFTRRDVDLPSSNAIVVNQVFAQRYFGNEPALGRQLDARFDDGTGADQHEIVGIVADARYDLRKPPAPTIYIPLRARTTGTIHVRIAGDAAALAPRVRDGVRASTGAFRVAAIDRESALVARTLLRERLLALLSGFFAVVGLMLVAVGLYGVLSYSVLQRTREIGIRIALGARAGVVVRNILAEAAGVATAGAVIGLCGGAYAARFVEALLFEVTPLDFWSLITPIGILLVTTLAAAALPALRASRVEPVVALRNE